MSAPGTEADAGAVSFAVANPTPQTATPSSAELLAEVAALTRALTGLTCGGSEFFSRKGDRYVADIAACVAYVERVKRDSHNRTIQALKRAHAAEDKLKALREHGDLSQRDSAASDPAGATATAYGTDGGDKPGSPQ